MHQNAALKSFADGSRPRFLAKGNKQRECPANVRPNDSWSLLQRKQNKMLELAGVAFTKGHWCS